MSKRDKDQQPKRRNTAARMLAESGKGGTRRFKEDRKELDRRACRGRLNPDDFLEGIEDEFADLDENDKNKGEDTHA
jgi:hypothetical protein